MWTTELSSFRLSVDNLAVNESMISKSRFENDIPVGTKDKKILMFMGYEQRKEQYKAAV